MLARIRVMAGLNPSESPLPQDARIRIPFAGRDIDLRVSTMPTLHGESVALRVLDTEGGTIQLDDLGLKPEHLQRLLSVVERPTLHVRKERLRGFPRIPLLLVRLGSPPATLSLLSAAVSQFHARDSTTLPPSQADVQNRAHWSIRSRRLSNRSVRR